MAPGPDWNWNASTSVARSMVPAAENVGPAGSTVAVAAVLPWSSAR